MLGSKANTNLNLSDFLFILIKWNVSAKIKAAYSYNSLTMLIRE